MRGPLQDDGPAAGMVVDFSEVSGMVKALVIKALDHTHLNDTLDNPTCERVIAWIWNRVATELPFLDELKLWETDTAYAILRRDDVGEPG